MFAVRLGVVISGQAAALPRIRDHVRSGLAWFSAADTTAAAIEEPFRVLRHFLVTKEVLPSGVEHMAPCVARVLLPREAHVRHEAAQDGHHLAPLAISIVPQLSFLAVESKGLNPAAAECLRTTQRLDLPKAQAVPAQEVEPPGLLDDLLWSQMVQALNRGHGHR